MSTVSPPEPAVDGRQKDYLSRLKEGVVVDKYCYGVALAKRRGKVLRLSEDNQELQYWPRSVSSALSLWSSPADEKYDVPRNKDSVLLNEIIGVIFGAYTCTFKKLKPNSLPPHWASFSLVATSRTYDFSSSNPYVVECCVRGLQQLVWDRRSIAPESSFSSVSAAPTPLTVGAKPWPHGFFLWMRLRFRLQEQAQNSCLGPDHMLWIVLMRCAFKSSDEVSKLRFMEMAEKLYPEDNPKTSSTSKANEIQEERLRIRFQKQRAKDIVEDHYACHIHQFLPHAPSAVVAPTKPPK